MAADRRQWHFGVLSFTGTGHLNALIGLAQELRQRGHRVTFFEKPKIEDRVRQAGLEFFAIGDRISPFKKSRPTVPGPSWLSELSLLRFNLARISHDLKTYLDEIPPALIRTEVNVLLINEIALTGPTLAQLLGLPYVIVSTSVPHNFGWRAYPWFSGYKYSASWLSEIHGAFLEVSAVHAHGPIRRVLNRYRRNLGLGPVEEVERLYPALAQITQLPRCLDLPRSNLPANFHYTGPFRKETSRPAVDFPWHRLDGRPIIYASLGTTRNVQPHVFRMIAEACQDLDLQLVISLGGRFDPDSFADLPGNPLITRYAPQLELLKLAKVVITHGGPNTVFESLIEGKPMVAIPLAYDQPAISASLARLNIAEVLPVMRLSADRIRTAVRKVLYSPEYRESAVKLQTKLQSLRGVERAAELIEGRLRQVSSLTSTGQGLRCPDGDRSTSARRSGYQREPPI